MSEYKLLIDGQLVEGDRQEDVIDPATEQVFTQTPRASEAQLNAAVAAARKAFPGWAALGDAERRKALMAIAEEVQAKASELAPIMVREHGGPMKGAMLELIVFAMKLKGSAMQPIPVKTIDVGPGRKVEQHYRPLGVVAAIVPWNVPLILLAAKLGPALVVGNTVVVKPAPTTSLTTLKLGEIIARHVPAGVVNVLSGDNDLGSALCAHPDVRMVAFTGSTATGKRVAAAASGTLKRFVLELGGNDPAIVLDDADPVDAAAKIFTQSMINAGQACIAIKRVYAQAGIYDRIAEELGRLFATAKVGNGFQEGVEFGPLQNRAQFDRVRDLLEDAKKTGRVVAQGAIPDGPGYFVPPTLIADVSNGDRIVDEEQFGPILPLIRFDDVEDAIAMANDSEFGLSASVFTGDVERGYAIAARLEAGTVTVNKVLEMHPMVPFGGAKCSGIGIENCEEGIAEYAQLQIMDIAN